MKDLISSYALAYESPFPTITKGAFADLRRLSVFSTVD
jgi:hypothetical protein